MRSRTLASTSTLTLAASLALALSCTPFPDDPPGRAASALSVPATIPVLMEDGSTVQMDLEEYVKGVLPNEMGASFPADALAAQAVAARSYAVDYTRNGKAICTTTKCQVWTPAREPESDAAVEATRGVVATFDGAVVPVFYSASCGGHTRGNEEAWGGDALPWLRGVPCIENKVQSCEVQCTPDTPGGDACWGVFGHRVGLCQRGAQAMARCGVTWDGILAHYLTGIVLWGPDGPVVPDGADDGGPADLPAGDEATDAGQDLPAEDAAPADGSGHDEGGADTPGFDAGIPEAEDRPGAFGCGAGPAGTGSAIGAVALAAMVLGAVAAARRRGRVAPPYRKRRAGGGVG